MATTEPTRKASVGKIDTHGRVFYASTALAAKAMDAGSIAVDLTLHSKPADLEVILNALAANVVTTPRTGTIGNLASAKIAFQAALENAAVEVIVRLLGDELGKFADAYRVYLRESLAKGESPQVQSALNRARLQEKIIASTPMVDQSEACELLGLSKANASATIKRKEDKHELLRFSIEGRPGYPLFQFDVEGRRIYPAMARLISAKPAQWSDFRLLHWLTRPHLDFDGAPAQSLSDEAAVTAAFEREIEPAEHG